MNDKRPLLILSGPTAVGKTDISIELAKKLDAEIINADSMQVYRGMDIGTAKIKPDEMNGVDHHLFDICDPNENFDVMTYQTRAKRIIDEITGRGHIPMLVGGTGFYIQAVLNDIDFTEEEPDMEYRLELEEYANKFGVTALHDRLKEVDPESADSIHENNIKRVIRALEYNKQTGKKFSVHNREQRENESPYLFLYAVLTLPRDILYERIEKRVDIMINEGLIDEVKSLLDNGLSEKSTAMQGLGYKEIASYLNGEYSLDEAIYILKRDTRHFAKRQLTWFKRERCVTFFDKNNYKDNSELTDAIITAFRKEYP